MRISSAAIFFTFFAATGQLSGLSTLVAGADSVFSRAPTCDSDRFYTVKSGDTCNSIATANEAPTYQIWCQNDDFDCNNIDASLGRQICLGRQKKDCKETYVVQWPDTAQSIADKFFISLDVFEDNNYCYKDRGSDKTCPAFRDKTVVCIDGKSIGKLQKCKKIFT